MSSGDEIAHLRDLDLHSLRARWKSMLQQQPPSHLPRHLLFAVLAYRLQADERGDLDPATVRLLRQIASTENCTVRQVNMTISLAFLAPNLVQAAVEGCLPRGVGIANLRDAPAQWALQYARLGLAP